MGLYKSIGEDIGEVDVIIAGGGTAGCIVAGRLAEADPNLSILVIERGPDNYGDPSVVTPAMFLTHLAPGSKTAIFYQARKSDHLAGREVIVPCGGILGGGSSINFMMYACYRHHYFDEQTFVSFAELAKGTHVRSATIMTRGRTPGWTADELYPFLKKLETYHGPRDEKHHGSTGPIQVSDGTLRLKNVEDDYLRAAAEAGWSELPDLQTLDHNNGFQRWLRYISPDGKRSDTAHMYLHPRLRDGKHSNLHVLVESQVVRVLFDQDKRACGVEYQPNPLFQSQEAPSPPVKRTIRARKLVVVSSGACGTPSVLERSGHDYEDHNLILFPFKTALEPHETLDELISGRLSVKEATERKDPRLGWNTIDVAAKLRFTEEDAASLGPDFKAAWERDFKHKPNRPVVLLVLLNA
ncbi:hypothetical protein CIB48_g3111 [Xylaria polymorpha]|nr:hypothetical protein CIB48_g3111 [Xylaria polymorpha]